MRFRFGFGPGRTVLPDMKSMILRSPAAMLSAALLLTGCGQGAASPDSHPPLAQLNGVIHSTAVSTPQEVRVALVWRILSANAELKVASELGVHAEFPAQFTFDINELPPEAALGPINSSDDKPIAGVRVAEGTLIVYEDLNGNDKLDLISSDATAPSPDLVLGTPADLDIGYLEGTIPPDLVPDLAQPGFHVIQYYDDGGVVGLRRLPISTQIAIDLTADPRLTSALCEWKNPNSCPPPGTAGAPDPCIPPGAKVTCMPDGSFTYEICSPLASLCDQACGGAGYSAPGDPRPPGWPCP